MNDLIVYGGFATAGVIIAIVSLMYHKGWIGGKARLIQLIAIGEHNLTKLRNRLEKIVAAETAKAAANAPAPVYPSQPVRDKAAELAENEALRVANSITPEEYAAKRKKILGID